jgi:hypothetical protein
MKTKFSPKSFNDNDARARAKAKEILSPKFEVQDNADPYDIDLICLKDNVIKYYVEVEVKNLWVGSNFPWAEINVPTRKEKYFLAHNNSMYIMFNSDLTSCFIMNGKTILDSPKVEVSNTRNLTGEYFFKVPYTKVIHHKQI